MRNFLCLLVLLVMVPVSAGALEDIPGVGLGEAIPHSLQLLDQNKEEQNFGALAGEKGTVLFFVRSADWCPFCKSQLIDLGEKGGLIEGLGYSVVTLSYDDPKILKVFSDKYKFPYTMLSDPESEAIKAFGVLNEEMKPMTRYYGVPYPVVYVVGLDKTIKARIAEEDYKNRPSVAQITEAINALN